MENSLYALLLCYFSLLLPLTSSLTAFPPLLFLCFKKHYFFPKLKKVLSSKLLQQQQKFKNILIWNWEFYFQLFWTLFKCTLFTVQDINCIIFWGTWTWRDYTLDDEVVRCWTGTSGSWPRWTAATRYSASGRNHTRGINAEVMAKVIAALLTTINH